MHNMSKERHFWVEGCTSSRWRRLATHRLTLSMEVMVVVVPYLIRLHDVSIRHLYYNVSRCFMYQSQCKQVLYHWHKLVSLIFRYRLDLFLTNLLNDTFAISKFLSSKRNRNRGQDWLLQAQNEKKKKFSHRKSTSCRGILHLLYGNLSSPLWILTFERSERPLTRLRMFQAQI